MRDRTRDGMFRCKAAAGRGEFASAAERLACTAASTHDTSLTLFARPFGCGVFDKYCDVCGVFDDEDGGELYEDGDLSCRERGAIDRGGGGFSGDGESGWLAAVAVAGEGAAVAGSGELLRDPTRHDTAHAQRLWRAPSFGPSGVVFKLEYQFAPSAESNSPSSNIHR